MPVATLVYTLHLKMCPIHCFVATKQEQSIRGTAMLDPANGPSSPASFLQQG